MGNAVVVVTGANDEIGRHMAASLPADGYRVAALDLAGERLTALQPARPDRLLAWTCDVTSNADVKAAVNAVISKLTARARRASAGNNRTGAT